MKVLLVFLMVFFLAGGIYFTGPDNLFASEDDASEKEMIDEDAEQELEGTEDDNKVDTDDYLRILNEEGQEETEPEEQSDDLNEDEKNYPDEKLIDDRG